MSNMLFKLNNLIAQHLVVAKRNQSPDHAVVYTATDGNVLYIHDDFVSLVVHQIVLHNNKLSALTNEGFQHDLREPNGVNACPNNLFATPAL